MKFKHGDRVEHAAWRDNDGQPARGRVHEFDLSDADRAEGCAPAEIRWHGTCVSTDDLDDPDLRKV